MKVEKNKLVDVFYLLLPKGNNKIHQFSINAIWFVPPPTVNLMEFFKIIPNSFFDMPYLPISKDITQLVMTHGCAHWTNRQQ